MSKYSKQCDLVLAAQAKRLSIKIAHHEHCECDGCIEERVVRSDLIEMPEHAKAQSNWVSRMNEILLVALMDREEKYDR